jgi:hypothetical protein
VEYIAGVKPWLHQADVGNLNPKSCLGTARTTVEQIIFGRPATTQVTNPSAKPGSEGNAMTNPLQACPATDTQPDPAARTGTTAGTCRRGIWSPPSTA